MNNETIGGNTGAGMDLKMMLEAVPGSFLILQTNSPFYTIAAASEDILRTTNTAKDALVGNSVYTLFPKNTNETSTAPSIITLAIQHAINQKKLYTVPAVQVDTINKHGETKQHYCSLACKPLVSDDGRVSYVILSMRAVAATTHNDKEQTALAEIERAYHFFMEAPVAICIVKGAGYIVELANESMLQFLGRTPAIIGSPITESLPEAKMQGLISILDTVRNSGEAWYTYNFPAVILIDGKREERFFDLTFKPYFDDAGSSEVTHIFCIAHNVTEQVIATKKTLEAEERARLAIDSADLGTYEVNLQTNEFVASERMAVIFDVEEKSDRERFVSAIYPEDQITRAEAYKVAAQTGLLEYDGRVTWKDGSIHWIRVKGKMYNDSNNKPLRLIGVIQDITEQKSFADALARKVEERTKELAQANQHLASINRELEQFTYAASHDMQEPLRKVHTFSNLLADHSAGQLDERSKTYLSKIGSSVQRMKNIIDDLLQYSHHTSHEQTFEPTDLNKVLQEIEADLELVIQQKQAVITRDTLPQLTAVPSLMNQLFFNLFSNALKFSIPGKPVNIKIAGTTPSNQEVANKGLDSAKPHIKISFSDNGIGFQQEYAEHIFSLFKRLHGRSEYEGTGIGLGLCKKIVQNHGGAIWAESRPGEGATFFMLLPL